MITHNKSFFVAGEMIDRRTMQQMGLPIGNAHLPPFKQREMPFAALGTAIAAAGTAIGTAAAGATMATVGAAALATVNAVAVAAMYAGVAMTVVGMVTGDKELMKIGGIVGLAGGVGSLAMGGIASLAAGGELSFGTTGIESLNAANAAEAGAGGASALAPVTGQAVTNATVQGEQAIANTAQGAGATGGNLGANVGAQATSNIGADIGAQAGGNIGQTQSVLSSQHGLLGGAKGIAESTGNALQNGTFLDKFIASLTPKDYVIGGFSALSGGAQMMQANQASAERQRQYEYQQGIRNQQIKNLNSVPTLTNKLDANAGLNASAGL